MTEPAPTPAPPHERGLWWLLVPAAVAIAGLTALASVTWTAGQSAALPASAQVGTGVTPPARPTSAAPSGSGGAVAPTGPAPTSSTPVAPSPAPSPTSTGATGGQTRSAAGTVVAPQYPVLDQGGRQSSGTGSEVGTDGGDGGSSGSGTDGSGPDGSGSSGPSTTQAGTGPSGGPGPTSTTSTTTGTQPEGTTGDR